MGMIKESVNFHNCLTSTVAQEDKADCKITRVETRVRTSVSSSTLGQQSFVQGKPHLSHIFVLNYHSLLQGGAMTFFGCQIREATNNFEEEKQVGKGGFGHVFRGRLRHSDVAIKVLNTVS